MAILYVGIDLAKNVSNSRAQQRKFNAFKHEYNEERPHEALDMRTTAPLYQTSPRPRPDKLAPLEHRIASRCATSVPTAGSMAQTMGQRDQRHHKQAPCLVRLTVAAQ